MAAAGNDRKPFKEDGILARDRHDLLAAGGVHGRKHEAAGAAQALYKPLAGFEKDRAATRDFINARTGQNRNERLAFDLEPQIGPCGRGIRRHRDDARQRVPDIDRGHARLAVDLFFKGKDEKNDVGCVAHRPDALRAPGPDRGRDEVHGGNAARLELHLHPEIEVGSVNADEDARTGLRDAPDHVAAKRKNARKLLDHLDVASHGKGLGRIPGIKPGGSHLRAAHAELRRAAHDLRQTRQHEACEIVAACLASDPGGAVGKALSPFSHSLLSH